jgi:hypothetical protein
MTKNTCSAVFALLVSLSLATPAGAAGTVASVGFQCTNDPQYRVWTGPSWLGAVARTLTEPARAVAAQGRPRHSNAPWWRYC